MGGEIQRLMDKERQEGVREGVLEATVSHIKNVMAAIGVPAEKAMDMLGIPPSQRGTYTELIGRA